MYNMYGRSRPLVCEKKMLRVRQSFNNRAVHACVSSDVFHKYIVPLRPSQPQLGW